MIEKFHVNDVVIIVGGTYKGRSGVIVNVTLKMVVVRLANTEAEVRLLKTSVEKRQKDVLRCPLDGKTTGILPRTNAIEISKLKLELELLQMKIDELTQRIAELKVQT
jgi:hypothetical protein